MTLPGQNVLGDVNILRDDYRAAIEAQRDQVAFLGTLWESTTPYVHPCATIGSDGERYYSMQSSTNQDPTNDITNAYWVLEMESGSNANGEYTKFADGTMHCVTVKYGFTTSADGSIGIVPPVGFVGSRVHHTQVVNLGDNAVATNQYVLFPINDTTDSFFVHSVATGGRASTLTTSRTMYFVTTGKWY